MRNHKSKKRQRGGTEVVKKTNKKNEIIGNIKLSSYNILARGNTHHNWLYHLSIDPGSSKNYESLSQTNQRYAIVTENILKNNVDIVCLQECDINFFKKSHNPIENSLKTKYEIYTEIIKKIVPKEKQEGGGPALLINKQFLKKWNILETILLNNTPRYGGTSKGVLGFKLENGNNSFWIVSGHFAFKDGRIELMQDIVNTIPKDDSIIIMGDYNAEPYQIIPEAKSLDLTRVTNRNNTGLKSNLFTMVNIDHVLTNNIKLFKKNKSGQLLTILESPKSPFKPIDPRLPKDYMDIGVTNRRLRPPTSGQKLQSDLVTKLEDVTPSKIVGGSDHCIINIIIGFS